MEELLSPLLKVPFEKANKSFRLFHKHVGREIAAMQKAVVALQQAQPSAQRVSLDASMDALAAVADKIRALQQDEKQFLEEQQKDVNSVVLRAQYVQSYHKNAEALAAASSTGTWPLGQPPLHLGLAHHGGKSTDPHQSMEQDRLIADYLLAHGYIKSSKLIQEAKGVEFVVDHDLHVECRSIINDLHAHNVSTAIAWCSENGSRLRRLQSQLEFQLRLQHFIELVRSDKKLDAIQYARIHLTPPSMQHEDEATRTAMMEAIQEAMATLAYPSPDQCGVPTYARLFSMERWQTLKTSFRTTFCQVYGMYNPPALCIALHAGLSSLNTRTCRRNREAHAKRRLESGGDVDAAHSHHSINAANGAGQKSKKTKLTASIDQPPSTVKPILSTLPAGAAQDDDARSMRCTSPAPPLCPTCSVVGGSLCASLPFAHHPHSRLVCRVTQTVMDEHNPPVALPNGYVYSRQAIKQLTEQNDPPGPSASTASSSSSASAAAASPSISMITCPVTQDTFSTAVLKPVFIL